MPRIGGTTVTRSPDFDDGLSADSRDVPNIRESPRCWNERPRGRRIPGRRIQDVRLGIETAAGPVRGGADRNGAQQPLDVAEHRRVERRRCPAVLLGFLERLRSKLRGEVDEVIGYLVEVARIAQLVWRVRLRRRCQLARYV